MMLMAYLSYITAEVRFFNIELKLPFIFVLGLVIGFYVTELCSLMMLKLVFQLFYLSGILTVFFCGIVMSHYTWHNVTENSRVTTKYVNSVNSFFNFWYPLHLHDNFFSEHHWSSCFSFPIYVQTCFCNTVVCLRDFHLPICWYGCLRHGEVDSCKQQVVLTSVQKNNAIKLILLLFYLNICSPCF